MRDVARKILDSILKVARAAPGTQNTFRHPCLLPVTNDICLKSAQFFWDTLYITKTWLDSVHAIKLYVMSHVFSQLIWQSEQTKLGNLSKQNDL